MKKNIWIFSHYSMSPSQGTMTRHYYFVKHLAEAGYQCKIFASSAIHNSSVNMAKGNDRYQEQVVDGVNYTYIRTRGYGKNKFVRILNMVDYFIGLFLAPANHAKPDAIYASMPHFLVGIAGVLIARRLKVKCVIEVRDLWPQSLIEYGICSKSNPLIWVMYKLEKWIYSKCDKLIFTMRGGYEYIQDRKWSASIPAGKVSFINNGCDLAEIEQNSHQYKYHDDAFQGAFVVTYTGSIRYVNNVNQVIECAKILERSCAGKVRFLLFGEGEEKDLLEKKCQEEAIRSVIFKGYVDKRYIPGILDQSDLVLIHSRSNSLFRYGFSLNKLFDALASGKPILSDLECNKRYDILAQYNCGISVKGNDPQALANGILAFLTMSKEERKLYGQRASAAAREFDYKHLTSQLIDCIEND